LDLHGSVLANIDLGVLAAAPLEKLVLSFVNLQVNQLAAVGRLTSLRVLGLSSNPDIRDSALKHLRTLSRLEALDLRHLAVTDTGMRWLRELARLEALDLSSTLVQGWGLAQLLSLRSLDLNSCAQVCDLLNPPVGLKSLSLRACWGVGPRSLERLSSCAGLEDLDMRGVKTELLLQTLAASVPRLKTLRVASQDGDACFRSDVKCLFPSTTVIVD
jgi:hypothetical protein